MTDGLSSPKFPIEHTDLFEEVYTQPLFRKFATTSVAQLVTFVPKDGDVYQQVLLNNDFDDRYKLEGVGLLGNTEK